MFSGLLMSENDKREIQNRKLLREFPWLWCLKKNWRLRDDQLVIRSANNFFRDTIPLPRLGKGVKCAMFCTELSREQCVLITLKGVVNNWATAILDVRPMNFDITAMATIEKTETVDFVKIYRAKSQFQLIYLIEGMID